jgi:hypothetical protein
MKFWTIVIFFISLFLAFIMGYYIGLTPEVQKDIFGNWKNVILFFTPIGVVVGIWRIVMEWYSEPSLKFGEITFDKGIYFIDVIKKRGKFEAQNCKGWLLLERASFPTISALANKFCVDIGDIIPLKLFEIRDNSIVTFSANPDGAYAETIRQYNEFIDRKLQIKISSSNAKAPRPYKKTIREIINKAESNV